ncbi:hypothetical protein [Leptobacterium sp. I13]|uniref:hypothetical protein n=1 Tax=Leptobacterium meishanense TaxID=3128904 RepID=UPI0030EBEB91
MTSTNKSLFSLGKLRCLIFGHCFIITRKVTAHIKEYECSCCKMQVTNDVKGNLAFLTPQLREINETLAVMHQKRHHHAHHTAA